MNANSTSRAARWAHDAVLDHTARVVHGLPDRVAQDRFAEVVSDLHEQAAASDAAGRSGLRLTAAVLRRAVLGLPADFAWRRGALRAAAAARPATRLLPCRPLPLAEGRPFDQTNGLIAFDPERVKAHDGEDALRLLERGAAANMINVGFGGGI